MIGPAVGQPGALLIGDPAPNVLDAVGRIREHEGNVLHPVEQRSSDPQAQVRIGLS